MSLVVVARKEVRDVTRARSTWAVVALLVLAVSGIPVGYVWVATRPSGGTLVAYLVTAAKWLVPVAGLVVGYRAVVGEREGNTLTFLLGQPHARHEVVLGKFLGRLATVWAAVFAGFVAALPVVALLFPAFPYDRLAVVFALTILLAAAFVGLAVALSSVLDSEVGVVTAAVGTFVGFLFLWDLVPAGAHLLAVGSLPGNQVPPDWFFLLRRLNPVNAYTAALVDLLPNLAGPVPEPRPVVLSPGFAVALLVAWTVIPLGIGTWRFASTDLA